jgi:hypothetical protein
MSKYKLSRRLFLSGISCFLLWIIVWFLELHAIKSIKGKIFTAPESIGWNVSKQGNLWGLGHPWILFETTKNNYDEWSTNIGTIKYPDEDELKVIPKQAMELGAAFDSKWRKFSGESSIIYFKSNQKSNRALTDESGKTMILVVVVNF